LEDIAIVGIDLKLPDGVNDENLIQSIKDKIVKKNFFPQSRINDINSDLSEKDYVMGSYFNRIDMFDHKYFNLSKRTTQLMDPNQRMCLMSVEDALSLNNMSKTIRNTNTGVYASANTNQQYMYSEMMAKYNVNSDVIGKLNSAISSRINYAYDLNGPSLMIDSACSSSLTSCVLAFRDLQNNKIDNAIVVSSNLFINPGLTSDKSIGIFSKDSITRPFDGKALGTSIGEGVACIIMKRLTDAERDKDYIYGTISSVALNNDGKTSNMSSPNPKAQISLLSEAWAPLLQEIDKLSFIEAHGTGTAIGDVIEFESLNDYFTKYRRKQTVALTAGKGNFGHLDVCSGMYALIKSLLMLREHTILPNVNFDVPNKEIAFIDSPFFVPTSDFKISNNSLAGVSSFGMTGTNAHIILRNYEKNGFNKTKKENHYNLKPYWFRDDQNSFEAGKNFKIIENPNQINAIFPLNAQNVWELREHKVNNKNVMVGTAFFEILSRALESTPYNLEEYDLAKVQILRQCEVQQLNLELSVSLEKKNLSGSIFFKYNDEYFEWIKYKLLKKTNKVNRAIKNFPNMMNLKEVTVKTIVGDSKNKVKVSERWNVLKKLFISKDNTRCVVQLEVPKGYEREFNGYNFYPSILDPAFNALNSVQSDKNLLFPWYWEKIKFNTKGLTGTRLVSEIKLDNVAFDENGNKILDYCINIWSDDKLVISIDKYKVKSLNIQDKQVRQEVKKEKFTPVEYKTSKESISGRVYFVHQSLRDLSFNGRIIRFNNVEDINLQKNMFIGTNEIYFVDKSNIEVQNLSDAMLKRAKFLMKLSKLVQNGTFIYCNQKIFKNNNKFSVAANRAIAAGLYALRLEQSLKIQVLDFDTLNEINKLKLPSNEDYIILRKRRMYQLRLEATNLHYRKFFEDNSKVLIIGGTSGIGKAYAEYLEKNYPSMKIIVCGRSYKKSPLNNKNLTGIKLDITKLDELNSNMAKSNDITHVLNFAGEATSGLFKTKSDEKFKTKSSSKIYGTYNICSFFKNKCKVVNFASLAGLIGAVGQSEYCFGNGYQLGIAKGIQIRTLALTGWKSVGMSKGKVDNSFVKSETDQGCRLIDEFLNSTLTIGYMYKEKNDNIKKYSTVLKVPEDVQFLENTDSRDIVSEKREKVKSIIESAWLKVLGQDVYAYDKGFLEQGGDSITIVDLYEELENKFPGIFDISSLFEISSMKQQVDKVLQVKNKSERYKVRVDHTDMMNYLDERG
jgi:3-oxoacyl-(acyl-carrier-protein) synthase/NAD(P)-dependent dehydrogenase (short-subunit alcohol dehydrogenase family)